MFDKQRKLFEADFTTMPGENEIKALASPSLQGTNSSVM